MSLNREPKELETLAQAEGVRDLFLEVYGDQYPVSTYYQPEELLKSQAENNLRCAIVEDDEGVCGHLALYPSAPSRDVWEVGAGLVAKRARGAAKIAELTQHLLNLATTQRFCHFVFAEAVCNHTITQRHTVDLGFIETAMEIDLMPASAYDKEKSAGGRVSSILSFFQVASRPSSVSLPTCYHDVLSAIYKELPATRELITSSKSELPSTTLYTTSRIEMAGLLRFVVEEIGQDFASHLTQESDVFQLMLPLNLPNIDHAVEQARSSGFFLGGLLPAWTGRDTLLMQRLNNETNWDRNKIHSRQAQSLFQQIREDAESVG